MKIVLIAMLFMISSRLHAIEFIGVEEVDKVNIINKYNLKNKKFQPYEKLDQIIKDLNKKKGYEYVLFQKNNNQTEIVAIRAKSINSISFTNNSEFNDKELLKISKLKQGEAFSKTELEKAIQRIKNAYVKRSYLNLFIKVEIDRKQENDSAYNLILNIAENRRCQVASIEFQSDNKKLNKSLQLHQKKYVGRHLTEHLLNKIEDRTESFLNKKQFYFSDFEIKKPEYNKDKTSATITVKLNNPYKYEFFIDGNNKVSRYLIKEQIEQLYIDNWSKDPVNKISEKIQNFYIDSGFIKSRVKVFPKTLSKEMTKRIFIKITEGEKVRINSIQFGGKFSLSNEELVKYLKKNSPAPLASNFFTQKSLDEGISNLIYDLKNRGYLHAKHISTRLKYIKNFLLDITIIINEGPVTNIDSIQIKGNDAIATEEILKYVDLRPNQILNLKKFETSLSEITNYYYNLGYIEMKFLEEVQFIEYSKNNTRADIVYHIKEGPQVRLKNVILEGNDFTHDYVILREIQLKPGDILSSRRIVEAQTNLTKLGLFTSVDIRTSDNQTEVSARDLLISVTERKPGVFKLGIGANNERGLNLRGYTGASYNNLFGTARAVFARLDTETRFEDKDFLDNVWKISGGYVEPYFFDSLIRGRVRTELERSISGAGETLKSNLNRRINFLLEKDLFKDLTFVWSVWQLDSQSQTLETTRKKERVDVAGTGASIYYDSRDDKFTPTKGVYTTLDYLYSTPELGASDEAHFMKTEAQFTTYNGFFNGHVVWANSLRGGYSNTLGNAEGLGIPEDYLFILGGMTTVRGFGGRSPVNRIPSSLEIDRTKQVIETNYAYFGLLKTEFRFLFPDKTHGPVIFWDSGIVKMGGEVGEKIKHPHRHSYGFGYRFYTPVGPFVFEYGFKARRPFGQAEKSGRFHISLGSF